MTYHLIKADEARFICDPKQFSFETTGEVEELTRFIGQDRALEAVDFGVSIRSQGFNLFVVGPEGSGRHSVIQSFINRKAAEEPTPADRCYVENFEQPHHPLALDFPPEKGPIFRHEMHELIDTLKTTIPAMIEGENYQARKMAITDSLQQRIDKLYHEVEERAKEDNVAVIKTEQGILFTTRDEEGKPLNTEAFLKLPKQRRKKYEKLIEKYQVELQQAIHQISILKREAEENKRNLKKDTGRLAVTHLVNTLRKKYEGRDKVVGYLDQVENQIVEGVDDFLYHPDKEGPALFGLMGSAPSFKQYEVNVLVGRKKNGAPVVYEDLPTYQNLHGRIEHKAKMGVLSTHFTLIKGGSLHLANGGYIIIDVDRLLRQPFAYEGLKRTLRSKMIKIEPVERLLGLMSTTTLEPEPIELATKVVLIGSPLIYYLLNAYDPEFQSLFKVLADFEHAMDLDRESLTLYATLLATVAKENELLPLHRSAVAKVIEHAARQAGDYEKLSLHIREFLDLLQEANYLALKGEKRCVSGDEIETALEAARRRGGRIRDQLFESIAKGVRLIDTRGSVTGQVNGLSVIQLAGNSFGCPTRITALTRSGKGNVVDIEREVKLGGAIHSKGVMILESYLGARYARKIPLSLRASLVFEQSYGGVDGDSASCAELCVLVSSIAGVAINQSLAITGSMNQQGEVQAIGGVNEKIEGFFDLCDERGLTGEQGVIIPASNRRHLMLRKEVVEAIDKELFSVYTVEHVDDALELLTGLSAGSMDSGGNYPDDSINGMVEKALQGFAEDIANFDKQGDEDEDSNQ
ncbi:MAG: ATP-binding protein [Thermodesulfobacteriota bacterium]